MSTETQSRNASRAATSLGSALRRRPGPASPAAAWTRYAAGRDRLTRNAIRHTIDSSLALLCCHWRMGATSVRYRRLGDSDLLVSDLGLGGGSFGNRVDVAQTREVVAAALDHGVTFFDTADTYGAHHGASEEALGQSLAKRRANVVLATKFGMDIHRVMPADLGNRGSGRYITAAVESSLAEPE